MAQNLELTWGKCTVGYKVGSVAQTEEPKIDSTKLNVAEGSTQEAKIEGGETIAIRRDSDTYTLEWDTYIHPANADKYKARIAEPNVNITGLVVTPSNKEALSIKAPFVKSGSTALFELAKAAPGT